ncbi:DUF4412 domain-containing protein [Acidobacteriota bacterium]
MKKTLMTLILIVLSAALLTADIYIKQKTHSDAIEMMGQSQPARDDLNEIWIGKKKMAMHGPAGSYIINLESNVMLMINHDKKSYIQMELPLEIDKYMPAQFLQMMGDVKLSITPTGETVTIGEWKCSVYEMEMSMMMFSIKGKIYAAKNVPFDWKKFQDEMYAEFTKATMMLGNDAVHEFQKIDGFQIKTETSVNMMNTEMKSYQEVIEISKKDAPAGTYDTPAGYTKKDKLSPEDIIRR